MKEYTAEDLKIEKETEQELKTMFPNKPLGECYAIHYIISRINLCSFMYIPLKKENGDNYFYNCYMKHYNEIKDKLTEELIEAICEFNGVGYDVIHKGNKGYNLAKIFGYGSLDKEDAFFEYIEPPEYVNPFAVHGFTSWLDGKSVLPYICKKNKEIINEIKEDYYYKYPPLKQYKGIIRYWKGD